MPPKNVFLGLDGTPQLSENEQRFVKALFKSMTAVPEADWDKCAEELGLKDSKCAKERWRQISTKRGWSRHSKRVPCASASTCEPSSTPTVATEDPTRSRDSATTTTQPSTSAPKSEQDESTSSNSAVKRQVASEAVKKETKCKHETVAKKEAEVKREKSPQEEASSDSRFFARKGVSKKNDFIAISKTEHEQDNAVEKIPRTFRHSRKRKDEFTVTNEAEDEAIVTVARRKQRRGNIMKPINLEDDDDEGVRGSDHKSAQTDDEDDKQDSDDKAHIPFGHPKHCMSF